MHALCTAGCNIANSWLQPKVVLLDVGMVTRLSKMDQDNMLGLFTSLSGMDGQGVANAVLSFSGQSCHGSKLSVQRVTNVSHTSHRFNKSTLMLNVQRVTDLDCTCTSFQAKHFTTTVHTLHAALSSL